MSEAEAPHFTGGPEDRANLFTNLQGPQHAVRVGALPDYAGCDTVLERTVPDRPARYCGFPGANGTLCALYHARSCAGGGDPAGRARPLIDIQ